MALSTFKLSISLIIRNFDHGIILIHSLPIFLKEAFDSSDILSPGFRGHILISLAHNGPILKMLSLHSSLPGLLEEAILLEKLVVEVRVLELFGVVKVVTGNSYGLGSLFSNGVVIVSLFDFVESFFGMRRELGLRKIVGRQLDVSGGVDKILGDEILPSLTVLSVNQTPDMNLILNLVKGIDCWV